MKWTSQQQSILSTVALTSFLNPFLISSVNIALPAFYYWLFASCRELGEP
ncbi:MAG: hypothetical protein LC643_04865 [Bacteroidales bacterium]|nr:hypothetical protein [Bacteroidales bacterium]